MQVLKSIIVIIVILIPLACSAQPNENFDNYWATFRKATLDSDYNTLNKLIKFPLEVKGVSDFEAVKQYDASQLPNLFPQLLAQPVFQSQGEDVIEKTIADLLQAKTKLDKELYQNKQQIRIDQWLFEQIDGRWYLVRAYLAA